MAFHNRQNFFAITLATLATLATYTTLSGCKTRSDAEWSESDLQALTQPLSLETPPPANILARIAMSEREVALAIMNGWAGQVNNAEQANPNSVLNQIRRLFDPEHMKKLSFAEALKKTKTEGSGPHGSAKNQRQPQDVVYHAMWNRIAEAAGFAGFSRSARHMRHYLDNSGQPIRYPNEETLKILDSAVADTLHNNTPTARKFTAHQLISRAKSLGGEPSQSEAEIIAGMSARQMSFYLSRLQVFQSLSRFVDENNIRSAEGIQNKLSRIKTKNFPARSVGKAGEWQSFRPIGKYYDLQVSEPQSDLYFSLGSFTSIYASTPIELKAEGGQIKIRFAQSISIYDQYNWDNGKFVTLFSGWCWKLNSAHCDQIERLTSLTVSDKSIGRLHKLGLAREFEIFGQTKITTVWDSVQWTDLQNRKKEKIWKALEIAISELLTPVDTMPD